MSKYKDLSEEILKVIQVAGINGALTTESVDYIKGILSANDQLLQEREYEKKSYLNIKEENKALESKLAIYMSQENDVINREKEVSKREEKITLLELELAFEKRRVLDHKEMFGLVFRNIEVRRNIYTPVSGGSDYQGKPMPGFTQQNEQVEKNV